jgi:hypothetical protein
MMSVILAVAAAAAAGVQVECGAVHYQPTMPCVDAPDDQAPPITYLEFRNFKGA